jgi:hypothetical protein
MRKLLATAAIAALLASAPGEPAARVDPSPRARRAVDVRMRGSDGRLVIAAAGDIACARAPNGAGAPAACQYDDTADLVAGGRLDAVLALGDNQYDTGALADYLAYFDPTWGRALADIMPVPGNHEYAQDPTSRPRGYFRYFGDRVRGPRRLGFYSFDLGACPEAPCWHLVALNSELCFGPGGCGPPSGSSDPGPGNRMYLWLRRDLAVHPDATYPCTLAYWHHPRFSFTTGSGASPTVGPLWDLLASASADLVLNGHSHNYQRWAPQDPAGGADPHHGIREFVVGTGGASHYAIPTGTAPGNLEAAQADAFGVLRLSLGAEGYRWTWVSAAGQPAFADRGAGTCVRATP